MAMGGSGGVDAGVADLTGCGVGKGAPAAERTADLVTRNSLVGLGVA
jgi:hypothetical protein